MKTDFLNAPLTLTNVPELTGRETHEQMFSIFMWALIRERRLKMKLSQRNVAMSIGISAQMYGVYETRSMKNGTVGLVNAVCAKLQIVPSELAKEVERLIFANTPVRNSL